MVPPMDEDDFVDIDIDGIEDPRETVPSGAYPSKIKAVEKKHKQGSEYPYLEIRLTPHEHPRKTLFLVLSFHPNALWNMKDFVQKARVEWKKGFHYKDLANKNIGVTVDIEPSFNDPNEKRNVVKPPYFQV